MIDDMPTGESTDGSRESGEQSSRDVLELTLPPKSGFLPLVRATAGVIAGGLSFTYDEIVQLRTATAEVFELSVKHAEYSPRISASDSLAIRFTITPDELEIFILIPEDSRGTINSREQAESEALLGSLMDEVDLHAGTPDRPAIRLIKYRPRIDG